MLGVVTTTGSVISVNQGSIAAVIVGGSIAASFTPPANQSVSGTVQTDVRGSIAAVIIGGSIAASFTPPANQSVSGTVGASLIGLSPVSVSNFPANQSVSGTISVTTTDIAPATQNITTVDLASSTAVGANGQSIVIGNPTAGSAASFALSGIATVRVEVTGIWTGTLVSEQSIDGGTTWTSQGLHQGGYTTSSFTAGFIGGGNVAGATNYRIRATAAITGTAVVKIIESVNEQSMYIANAAPAGTVISLLNSTTATLGIAGVYTGTGEDVSNFSEMRISVFSDQASATDGLSIQQSTNNTNWDIVDTYTIAASTGKTFVVPRQARYFRIVYTNGGTGQGAFRLQSILNRTATAPSSQRPTDAYSNETDLVQNQMFGMVYNEATWDRLRGNATQGLKVFGSVSAAVSGSVAAIQSGTQITSIVNSIPSSVLVGASIFGQLPAGTAVLGSIAALQGTNPWTVVSSIAGGIFPISGSVAAVITNANVNVSGSVVAFQGTSPWVIQSIVGTYSEDVAFADNDKGILALGVRNDTVSSFVGTNLDYTPHSSDSAGRTLIKPFAAEEARVEGYNSVVSGSVTTLVPTAGTGLKNYITDVWFANTGASTALVTFQDGLGSVLGYTIAPAGGGSNLPGLATPLRTGANTSFDFKVSPSSSIIYGTARGFKAP